MLFHNLEAMLRNMLVFLGRRVDGVVVGNVANIVVGNVADSGL